MYAEWIDTYSSEDFEVNTWEGFWLRPPPWQVHRIFRLCRERFNPCETHMNVTYFLGESKGPVATQRSVHYRGGK